jgi:hypothetical protein
MEEIIRRQRATVEEHIGQENAHNWSAVYDTFAPHESAIDGKRQGRSHKSTIKKSRTGCQRGAFL